MELIGLTGPIKHGKTSLASAIGEIEPASIHLESFDLVAEAANQLQAELDQPISPEDLPAINRWLEPFPQILEKVLHIPRPEPIKLIPEQLQHHPEDYEKLFMHLGRVAETPELLQQVIAADNKEDHRALLQWIGNYVTTYVDSDAWYRELVRQAHVANQRGVKLAIIGGLRFPSDGYVIHKAKGIIVDVMRPNAPHPDVNDPTERQRRLIRVDTQVINDGTLEQLKRVGGLMLKDYRHGRLKTLYQASLL